MGPACACVRACVRARNGRAVPGPSRCCMSGSGACPLWATPGLLPAVPRPPGPQTGARSCRECAERGQANSGPCRALLPLTSQVPVSPALPTDVRDASPLTASPLRSGWHGSAGPRCAEASAPPHTAPDDSEPYGQRPLRSDETKPGARVCFLESAPCFTWTHFFSKETFVTALNGEPALLHVRPWLLNACVFHRLSVPATWGPARARPPSPAPQGSAHREPPASTSRGEGSGEGDA